MRMWSKGNTPLLLVGVKICISTLEISMAVSENWDSIYLKTPRYNSWAYEDAQSNHKDTCSTMFITVLFVIAISWKKPRYPLTKKWIKKMWYICILEYYSAEKKQ